MATGAHKHKKLDYRLFKDKYVTQVQVKPNVKTAHGVTSLVKAAVHASMKKQSYVLCAFEPTKWRSCLCKLCMCSRKIWML